MTIDEEDTHMVALILANVRINPYIDHLTWPHCTAETGETIT